MMSGIEVDHRRAGVEVEEREEHERLHRCVQLGDVVVLLHPLPVRDPQLLHAEDPEGELLQVQAVGDVAQGQVEAEAVRHPVQGFVQREGVREEVLRADGEDDGLPRAGPGRAHAEPSRLRPESPFRAPGLRRVSPASRQPQPLQHSLDACPGRLQGVVLDRKPRRGVRHPGPGHLVLEQGDDLGCELVGVHGHGDHLARDELHPLDGERRRDAGNAVGEAGADLPLHPRPVPERSDGETDRAEELVDVLHVSDQTNGGRRVPGEARGHVSPHDAEGGAGETAQDTRPDVREKVLDGVDVGFVEVSADEAHPLARREGLAAPGALEDQGQRHQLRTGDLAPQEVVLEVRDDDGEIGAPRHVELPLAHLVCGVERAAIAGEPCLALLAQEVQVHGLENNLRPGAVAPHALVVPTSGVDPEEHCQREAVPFAGQERLEVTDLAGGQATHAGGGQRIGVAARLVRLGVGVEAHLPPELEEEVDQEASGDRARIAVRTRVDAVDEQHPRAHRVPDPTWQRPERGHGHPSPTLHRALCHRRLTRGSGRRRPATLRPPVPEVVGEGLEPAPRHVRVGREVPAGVEVRVRTSALAVAEAEVVNQGVHPRALHVGVGLEVPAGGEEGRGVATLGRAAVQVVGEGIAPADRSGVGAPVPGRHRRAGSRPAVAAPLPARGPGSSRAGPRGGPSSPRHARRGLLPGSGGGPGCSAAGPSPRTSTPRGSDGTVPASGRSPGARPPPPRAGRPPPRRCRAGPGACPPPSPATPPSSPWRGGGAPVPRAARRSQRARRPSP